MVERRSSLLIKEIPSAVTPWAQVNELLSSQERFSVECNGSQRYLLTPKHSSQLAALFYFFRQHHLSFSIQGREGDPCDLNPQAPIISTRGFSHIQWYPEGIVEIGGGCPLDRLHQFLFEFKEETPLEEAPFCSSKRAVGDLILSGNITGLSYRQEACPQTLKGLELVTWEGAQLVWGGIQKGCRAGPCLHQLIIGLGSVPAVITKMIFKTFPTPEKRLRMAWMFARMEPLLQQLNELKRFASSWESLDIVLSGDLSAQSFIFAQISGSQEEMEQFSLQCPRFAQASLQGEKQRVRTFLLDQQLKGYRSDKHQLVKPGDYLWIEEQGGKAWGLTKESFLNDSRMSEWKELFLQGFDIQ